MPPTSKATNTRELAVSLRQAIIWIAHGTSPLKRNDEDAIADWPDVSGSEYSEARRQLILALRHGKIQASGMLDVYVEGSSRFDDQNFRPNRQWDKFFKNLKEQCSDLGHVFCQTMIIPGDLWEERFIDWRRSSLHNNEGFSVQGRFDFIEINGDFLIKAIQPLCRGESRTEARIAQAGRPRRYDWDGFYTEIVAIADLDGLPEIQADLERRMAEWCSLNWGSEPSDEAIRQKIAPIYRHPRKAKK